jgi:hypothetical protein
MYCNAPTNLRYPQDQKSKRNHMLKIEIGNRTIIPVRLIPFVTGWKFPPDSLVRILANRDGFNRVFLQSFTFYSDGSHQKITPKEWDTCLADLEILTNTLKASEQTEDENYPVWRFESIKMLPAGTFVWLDELATTWCNVYSPGSTILLHERPGDRAINLAPLIPSNVSEFIYCGFEALLIPTNPTRDNRQNSITRFSELHHFLMTDPYYGVDSAAAESILNGIYQKNSGNALFQNFRRRFSLLPCKDDIHKQLIYLWCGFMDLPSYSGNQVLNRQSVEYLDHWTDDFNLHLDELREFLRRQKLPLPSYLFPDAVDNTERKLALDKVTYEAAFHDFTIVLPQLEKDLAEVVAIQPESMEARQQKKDAIEKIKKNIEVIINGVPGEDSAIQLLGSSQSRTTKRNIKLQNSANKLAEQMKKAKHRHLTKRDISLKLSISDEWNEMTAIRIERLIVKTW